MDERQRNEVEELIGEALERSEPLPPSLHQTAVAFGAFIDIDASVAELLNDELAASRDPRLSGHTYAWPDGSTLTVQFTRHESIVRATGFLSADKIEAAWVETTSAVGRIDIQLYEGTFELAFEPDGPYRFKTVRGGQTAVTPWVR